MATAKFLLVVAAACYLGIVALMYFTQRAMMYFPEAARTPPTDAGFPEAEEVVLESGGERVIAWHVAPRGDLVGGGGPLYAE